MLQHEESNLQHVGDKTAVNIIVLGGGEHTRLAQLQAHLIDTQEELIALLRRVRQLGLHLIQYQG